MLRLFSAMVALLMASDFARAGLYYSGGVSA